MILSGEISAQKRRRFISYGTSCAILDPDGTISVIKTGLTADRELNGVAYNNNVYFFNGVDTPFKYDFSADGATAVSDIGLTQPTLGSATSALSGNTGNVRGIVKYFVSFVSTSTEGPLSDAFGEIDAGDGNIINLSNIPTGGAGVTARYLYRTSDRDEIPLFLGVIEDNTTTTFTDNVHDRDLGGPPGKHGAKPLPTLNYPILHFNRIWAAVNSDIYFSDRGEPESWFGANRMQIWKDDGDNITGLARDSEGIFVFKQNHLYKVLGRDPQVEIFTVIELTPADQNIRSVGAPSNRAIASTDFGVAFYCGGRVCLITSGSNIQTISAPIDDELRSDINFNAEEKIQCKYYSKYKLLLVSVPTGSSTENNRTYGYLFDQRAWFRISKGFTAFDVIETGADNSPPDDLELWGAAADQNGFVHKLFDTSTNQFDGANISTEAVLSPIFGFTPSNISRFLKVLLRYKTQSSGTLTVNYKLDSKTTGTDVAINTVDATRSVGTATINIGQQARELILTFKSNANQPRNKIYGFDVVLQGLGFA